MKLKTIKYLGLGLAVAAVLTISANATLVVYSTSPASGTLGLGKDSVTLSGVTGSVSLIPNAPSETDAELFGLTWNYSSKEGPISFGTINTLLDVTLAVGPAQTISDFIDVTVARNTSTSPITGQTLNILPISGDMYFNWTEGGVPYVLSVDPLSLTMSVGGGSSTATGTLEGSFYLTAIPEPTTLISGALLLLPFGASTLRILRRNRTV